MKKLTQIGNSWGVILPKPILDVVHINPILDKIELIIENDEIRIKKVEQ